VLTIDQARRLGRSVLARALIGRGPQVRLVLRDPIISNT
jgi:hypothetical protein